jgi:DNA-binding transcriptional LysR family regulator
VKYTLRQLEIFLAVARHQNISRAAKELHMSQSAASESLLNLEHTFELTLFDRVSNKLQLNAAGTSLRTMCNLISPTLQRSSARCLTTKSILA